ncbi:MAG: hypothetical protein RLZ98_2180 [Pseudomonadota bacterium]|jgi:glutathione S-transferase
MKLLGSLGSPFVRKALICAHIKGAADKIQFVVTNSGPEADALRARNPLGKIPILFLDDGTTVYDSHVICEYIDTLSDTPKLFPAAGPGRLKTLTLAALADGLAEASILVAYESRFRPKEMWVQSWVDRQQAKVDAALAHLEQNVPTFSGAPDYGHVALATSIGFVDLRQGADWRAKYPKVAAWQDDFAARVPSYAATMPKG